MKCLNTRTKIMNLVTKIIDVGWLAVNLWGQMVVKSGFQGWIGKKITSVLKVSCLCDGILR